MVKEYKHLVMFDSLVEAFEYQNEKGGELYNRIKPSNTRNEYWVACVVDEVTFVDMKKYPFLVANDFVVDIIENK
jgi:hypothetical protein